MDPRTSSRTRLLLRNLVAMLLGLLLFGSLFVAAALRGPEQAGVAVSSAAPTPGDAR